MDADKIIRSVLATVRHLGKSRLLLAYSGGRDSTVLLHLLAAQREVPVCAVHIDHGLQGAQPEWLGSIAENCAKLDVPLSTHRLELAPCAGDSIEALARKARYRTLAECVSEDELLLLAQHQSDQAETVLLQLLRGSGPAGLAAMPQLSMLGDVPMLRPLLDVSGEAIAAYAASYRLRWFDDPSNADERFARNHLRATIMPRLRERWPGVDRTLSRAAGLQAEAAGLLDQQAARDAREVGLADHRLKISSLMRLPLARQRNLIRYALRVAGLTLPPQTRLRSIEALCAQVSGRGEVRWAEVSVRRYRDTLFLLSQLSTTDDETFCEPVVPAAQIDLPLGGSLIVDKGCLGAVTLTCRYRRRGDRIREQANGSSKALSRWFQQHAVPPWERQRVPLLLVDDEIAAIGDQWLPRFAQIVGDARIVWHRSS